MLLSLTDLGCTAASLAAAATLASTAAAAATSAARGAGRRARASALAAAATLLLSSQGSCCNLLGSGATAAASARVLHSSGTLAGTAATSASTAITATVTSFTAACTSRTANTSSLAAAAALLSFRQSTIGSGCSTAAALAFVSICLAGEAAKKDEASKHQYHEQGRGQRRSGQDNVQNQEKVGQEHEFSAPNGSFQLASLRTHHFESDSVYGWSISNRFSQFLLDLALEFGVGVNCQENLLTKAATEVVLLRLLESNNQDEHQHNKVSRHEA